MTSREQHLEKGENRAKGSKYFNFLQEIDIFGIPIQLMYKKQTKHTTRLGGIISLSIAAIIAVQVYSLLKQVIQHEQPQVISQEKIVASPSRNNLSPDNFTFLFGLLDSSSAPFINETIYSVSGEMRLREKTNITTIVNGVPQFKVNQTSIPLNIQPCKKEFFTSTETKSYFLSLNYTNLYCIKLPEDQQQLFLQGQFDNDIFSFIRLTINICNEKTQICQSETDIINKLSRSYLQIYYINQIVEVTNYKFPFKQMGQTQFWNSNTDFMQRINLMYQSVYMVDDTGIFLSSKEEKKTLKFSSDRVFMSKKDKPTDLFDISIFLEKNKEFYYMRYYLKIDNAASFIGGLFNFLLLVGSFISKPYSKLSLNHKLINSTFNFTSRQKDALQNQNSRLIESFTQNKVNLPASSVQLQKKNINAQKQGNEISQSHLMQVPTTENKVEMNFMRNRNASSKDRSSKQQDQKNKQASPNQKCGQNVELQDTNKIVNEENQKSNLNENQDKRQLSQQVNILEKINLTFKDYVKGFLSLFFSCFQSDLSQMIQYSQKKLDQFTDIRYIINKLVELDKLKMLLLDENQLQLFNFIEKPLVDSKCIQEKTFERQLSGIKEEENVNALYRKTDQEQQQYAEKAFEKVIQRQSVYQNGNSSIDKKLVKLIDTNLYNKLISMPNIKQQTSQLEQLNETIEYRDQQVPFQSPPYNEKMEFDLNSIQSCFEINQEVNDPKERNINTSKIFKKLTENKAIPKIQNNQIDSLVHLDLYQLNATIDPQATHSLQNQNLQDIEQQMNKIIKYREE